MGDDDWQRVFVLRLPMNEVDVQSVDLGDELRERVQAGLYVSCRQLWLVQWFLDRV
jgi:hypothetical protein